MRCPNCGKEILDDSNFCEYCGTNISAKRKWLVLKKVTLFTLLVSVVIGSMIWYKLSPSVSDYETTDSELTVEKIPDNFVLIEGGMLKNYEDGYDTKNDKAIFKNIPLDSFYISKYEVIQKDFTNLMPDNPSAFVEDSLPIMGITFAEAAVYCNRLSQSEGYDGFYNIHDDTISFNPKGSGYRLPTKYEWAYAARDRREQPYKYVSGDNIKEIAWYGATSGSKPHKVGTKASNSLGIYDMTGNVEELYWPEDGNIIRTPHIWGGYDLWNFASHCFKEHNAYQSEYYNDETGMRLVFIPKSIQTNNNIRMTKSRVMENVLLSTWKEYSNNIYCKAVPYNLGRIYEYGYGVKKDLNKALVWYQRSSEIGDKRANDKLINSMMNGY